VASDDHPAPKRIFSYAEAAALLPEVRRLTEEAQRRVEALGGEGDAPRERRKAEVDEALEHIVDDWARAVMRRGLEVKGVWLVDFDNGSGYYCWRYPEDGLHYYHSYEDGFRGRLRIQ
jgi:hypothetical protein